MRIVIGASPEPMAGWMRKGTARAERRQMDEFTQDIGEEEHSDEEASYSMSRCIEKRGWYESKDENLGAGRSACLYRRLSKSKQEQAPEFARHGSIM